MKSNTLFISVTAFLAAPFCLFASPYTVEVIGPIDSSYTFVNALNNGGTVLGNYGGQFKQLYLSNNGVQTFPGDLGGLYPNASGLNDAGDFAGQYFHNGNYHAFVSIGGIVTDLGAIGGTHFSGATDINNVGQIVGQTSTDSATTRAFRESGGIMTELGTLGGDVSSAQAINDLGDIAGYSSTLANVNHAFFYSGGIMSDLGTLGGKDSYADDVNKFGQVVGYSNYDLADNGSHAFLYNAGALVDLGTLGGNGSWANAINDDGFIVGSSFTLTNVHAFISDGLVMTDLNSLIDLTGTGLQYLSSAKDINASGQITGEAIDDNGRTVTYLLTRSRSVPDSSIYGWAEVMLLMVVAVGGRRRLRQAQCSA